MSIKSRSFARGSVMLCTGSWSCRLVQCLPPLQPAFQSPAAAEVIAARDCISDQLPPFRRASPPCRRNRRPGQPRMAKGYRCGRLAQLTDSLALCLKVASRGLPLFSRLNHRNGTPKHAPYPRVPLIRAPHSLPSRSSTITPVAAFFMRKPWLPSVPLTRLQYGHSNCRFRTSCSPSSLSATMWSTSNLR